MWGIVQNGHCSWLLSCKTWMRSLRLFQVAWPRDRGRCAVHILVLKMNSPGMCCCRGVESLVIQAMGCTVRFGRSQQWNRNSCLPLVSWYLCENVERTSFRGIQQECTRNSGCVIIETGAAYTVTSCLRELIAEFKNTKFYPLWLSI
jgi:hypothetical protein